MLYRFIRLSDCTLTVDKTLGYVCHVLSYCYSSLFGLWTKCVSNYRRRSFSQNGHSLSCCYSSYSLLNFQLSINHSLSSFPHLNHFSIILRGSFLGSSLYHKTKQPKNKKTNKTAKQSTVCLNETYIQCRYEIALF